MLMRSKRVICMDAYLSARSIDLTEKFARRDSQPIYKPIDSLNETSEDVLLIDNSWRK